MKLTKRILCLAMAAVMLFALCACGDKEEEEKSGNPGGFVTNSSHSANSSDTTPSATEDDWDGNLEGDEYYNDGSFSEW